MHINQLKIVERKGQPEVAWQEEHRKPNNDVAWMQLVARYTLGSHIHGFYRLFWPTMRRRMRLLWTLALLCALTVLIYITYLLGERHQRKHFHTVIADSHWPIQNIVFPVIIVCNRNRLNWSRLEEISRRYNIGAAQQPLLERILLAYDSLSFAHFGVFASLRDEPLDSLNYLNFTQIATEMAWRCDELLADCSWQTESRNCCELFRPRRLPQGACLAFNELEQRRSAEMGWGTGLVVQLRLNEALHAPANRQPKGFVLNILEPSVWYDFPITLTPDMDTNIGIKAVYHYYDEATFSLPSLQRQCLQDYEYGSNQFQTLQGFKYMLENCFAECQQLYMIRYCNCTLDLFYPPSDHVACQLKDLPCLAAHNQLLQNYEQPAEHPYVSRTETGLICECLHNCKSLTLVTDVRKHVLRANATLQSGNRSMMLNIYYNRKTILVYKTSLIYSWIDLIVSFGAICQLCLGCSIISLLEVLYFGLVDVPRFYWTQYALRRLFSNQ